MNEEIIKQRRIEYEHQIDECMSELNNSKCDEEDRELIESRILLLKEAMVYEEILQNQKDTKRP